MQLLSQSRSYQKGCRVHSTILVFGCLGQWGLMSLPTHAADPEAAIEWLGGPVTPQAMEPDAIRARIEELAGRPLSRHVLVQFSLPLTRDVQSRLETSGLKLLQYVGSNAFFASLERGRIDAGSLSREPALTHVAAVEQAWKLHPMLHAGEVPTWAVVNEEAINKSGAVPTVGAYILFHPDVPLVPDGESLTAAYGAKVMSRLESVNGLVIELPFPNIAALADEDAVQWIEPPLPRMSEVNNSNRVITQADIVQAAPYGLNGAGVTVLVYDGGFALASHPDFGGRLTVRDSSGLSNHGTHVSGTVGGSGAASGGQFRGMAPGVTIQSYGFETDGSGIFLYSNPGDMEDDYDQAMNSFGADISNNSIGTNTCSNGFPCSITGDYGVTSALIDNIVRGSLGSPFRVVWANGNERSCSGCPGEHMAGYHSTAPPACAKNHLTVGALNSNNDSQTSFTSWGPCDDGRLKPDVSAPGCQSNGDGGVTSCSSSGGYTVFCGTSMASPTVCGLSALLLQDFRVQFPGEPDFRNSTLRAMMAHTAEDRGNIGPDYQFGYGSVRIQAAVDFMRTGNFLEESTTQGGAYSVLVIVPPGQPFLKVTLAWDDPAAAPNVNPSLVNDLDLVVFDPSSVQQFPWTLNPGSPATPAVRTQADRRNNIEQVYVANPAAGAWRVEVRGFNVPTGPQTFSLCASPQLVNCSTLGVLTLDRVKYACESTATIQVVDCDLNTDNGAVETISVTIESDIESGGESVLLTETAAETAVFRGSIDLSMTDATGVLHVASGNTVTARYVDADDSFGGINVPRTAVAVVDCQPPVISNVQATNVGPASATITFATDESAAGTVRYGTSCGSLAQQAAGTGFQTAHSIALAGLTEDTSYFFAVDAVDQAGNSASDDNGGLCFTFMTPDIPNYFTEQFAGEFDLDNLTVVFTPDGSFDFYRACAEPITVLPVDPTGGQPIASFTPNNDDGSSSRTISGGSSVSIYGTSFTTFFVGSNGYITFGAGDDDYDETLAEHFSFRRIAALYDDLNPGVGGSVSWRQLPDRAVITWQNVPEYNTSNSNTFQVDMGFDGTIRVSYLSIAAGDGIAGLSSGGGLPNPFIESDLSGSGGCADCNQNGIPDYLDIQNGTSEDCNTNGVPDECESNLDPSIVRHPGNATVCEGGNAQFGVVAEGYGGPLEYQWEKDLQPINGANADAYNLISVQIGDAGSYRVVVNDECGSVTSTPASLAVTTLASCADSNPCTLDGCQSGSCTHSANTGAACNDGNDCTIADTCTAQSSCTGQAIVILYADIVPSGGDGVIELSDTLCILDGYNIPEACPNGDIAPCGGDGVIELADVLAVIDAYNGVFLCPHPCPP